MTTTSLPSWNFLCTIKYLALCQYPAGLTRTISLQSFKIVAVLYKFKLIGRRERPWARIIHRSSPPASSLLRLRLGKRGEESGRGLGEFTESLPMLLPSSVSASETRAEIRAEGSEEVPRVSACSSVLCLLLRDRTVVGRSKPRSIHQFPPALAGSIRLSRRVSREAPSALRQVLPRSSCLDDPRTGACASVGLSR